MSPFVQMLQYFVIRFEASAEADRDRGEVSATTVVLAAALIALAIAVGAIITSRVTNKANTLNLG
jgi:heme/copper-type cytochrome/quinol oxidase subunit 2